MRRMTHKPELVASGEYDAVSNNFILDNKIIFNPYDSYMLVVETEGDAYIGYVTLMPEELFDIHPLNHIVSVPPYDATNIFCPIVSNDNGYIRIHLYDDGEDVQGLTYRILVYKL